MSVADRHFPELQDDPRDHHYVFAHVALPQIVHSLEARDVDLQALGESELLSELWRDTGERIAEPGRGEHLSPEGLSARTLLHGEHTVLELSLPPARRGAEAMAIAIARVPIKRLVFFKNYALRYFTLELGMDFGDAPGEVFPRTVLCEWTEERAHHNMGDGPEPEDFGDRVLAML